MRSLFGMVSVGLTMPMQALCPIRTLEFMPFAGTETESKQEGEQCETFHRAPLRESGRKGNPVSLTGKRFCIRYFLMRSPADRFIVCDAGICGEPRNHVRPLHRS